MEAKQVTKEQWVAMFTETGLDDAMMNRWHQIFEARHPEAHQAFLQWLKIDPQEITQIRAGAGKC